jgi:hypothetical protein
VALERIPLWSQKALQGITYWIGHRRSLYDHYPLGESAFVAELCNLIFAHLRGHVLRCEVQYNEIAGETNLPNEVFGRRARADLVVFDNTDDASNPIAKYIIEVKRGSAPKREINNDLRRLLEIKRVIPECRTFLFVISEANRHKRFVTDDGQSVPGPHPVPGDAGGHFRNRRTFKAAHAFKTKDTAQYASCLEVYDSAIPKRSRR